MRFLSTRMAALWRCVGLLCIYSALVIAIKVEAQDLRRDTSWKAIFREEFNLEAPTGTFSQLYRTDWNTIKENITDTSRKGVHRPSKVISVSNGSLRVHIFSLKQDHLVAGLLPRKIADGLLYGRFAMRFKADRLPGYRITCNLWPVNSSWPESGSIAFPDGDLVGSIKGFVHYAKAKKASDQLSWTSNHTYGEWKIASIEWTPGRIQLDVDGDRVTTTERIPTVLMQWIIAFETSFGPLPPDDKVDGSIWIDWISIDRYIHPPSTTIKTQKSSSSSPKPTPASTVLSKTTAAPIGVPSQQQRLATAVNKTSPAKNSTTATTTTSPIPVKTTRPQQIARSTPSVTRMAVTEKAPKRDSPSGTATRPATPRATSAPPIQEATPLLLKAEMRPIRALEVNDRAPADDQAHQLWDGLSQWRMREDITAEPTASSSSRLTYLTVGVIVCATMAATGFLTMLWMILVPR